MGFDCGDNKVEDYQGKGTGFVSHHEVKRGLVSDGVRAVIVGELGVGDVIGPRSGVVSTEDPKVRFDFLVYSFGFSIGLGVVGGREG